MILSHAASRSGLDVLSPYISYLLDTPITASGSAVAMPGNMQQRMIATNIRPTKGMTPQITSFSGMSGAIFLMTKMLSPTGGWIRPISMTMVMTMPNQIRSNPAALSGGRMIGAVIRMMDTGGRPALPTEGERVKIPKILSDWTFIEAVAAGATELPLRPSQAQVAAVMLHMAVSRFSSDEITSALQREKAT